MPRRIARGVGCAVIAVLLLPGAASAAFGDRPLRMGMHGKDVVMLQSLLTKAGFRTVADGQFGRRTRRAAGRWEAARERDVNGRMSRRDLRALRREFPAPTEEATAPIPGTEGLVVFGARERAGVSVEVDGPGTVTAEVADGAGTVVRTLSRSVEEAGTVRLRWNGRIARRPAPEGPYLVRLGDGTLTADAAAQQAPQEFEFRHHVFPIRGKHDLGRNGANGFGGGRGHQGQDMFARCGTPVRAAQGGTVQYAAYHAAAGHYLVVRGAGSGEDYVYMHLRDAPTLAKGDKVKTGERIGAVGRSGRADGCHLHFELWSEPGWYKGGSARDPLPELRRWDAWS